MKPLCKILSTTALLGFSFIAVAKDSSLKNTILVPKGNGEYVRVSSTTINRPNVKNAVDICWEDPLKGPSCFNGDTREVYPNPEKTKKSD
ncbi:hypothetical protein QE197_16810 [Arsenophonus nasoniae]|uniref:Uncharacterized protein n=1 Tax=Arsenophonus nasoniae TaxID=638 RepID=D2TWL8_9GAMM|nr:hypothetical protein [Arsenophonus nasoniae]QBY45222.1 hypothetical protein ArsFIN_38190 [Arsenophonus nasoniae]WGM01219.1 hypothetical protein QE210_15570 [Arsenophonus nasoniae]WGM05405.1 hypothetical protein QE258_18185 [Arsenophonus nasoniae]WGM10413.1 hypothetical protein QE197_16810 [Arsenophonus nasoniae]WGM15124.1 hypothetical protein QE193_16700 [Arsenophonus nasoniae]